MFLSTVPPVFVLAEIRCFFLVGKLNCYKRIALKIDVWLTYGQVSPYLTGLLPVSFREQFIVHPSFGYAKNKRWSTLSKASGPLGLTQKCILISLTKKKSKSENVTTWNLKIREPVESRRFPT